ncbi:MAG: Ig-like domain-containing protein, partial [Clostridiales bacterium]|nr:Ig-like domain-containing protein [Clostridiales bacterium]
GETDSAHPRVTQDIFGLLSKDYAAAGHSEEWINDHVHISGIQSWKFKAWGETDHSVTKMTAFYYLSKPYLDVWEGQEDLKPGDKYTLAGKEDTNYCGADEFEYLAYEESVAEWAINVVNGVYDQPVVKEDQVISTSVTQSILTSYGSKPFNLNASTSGDGRLTYKSNNTDVVKVDKNGKVTIVGTGKATVTITAHSSETCNLAVKKIVIRVVPAKAEIKSLKKAGKGAFEVKVKKDMNATGYMVQYSANKSFTKAVNIMVGKVNQNTITVKKLASGKTFYVRVCAYKKMGGSTYCGKWSNAGKVTIK